MAIKRKAKSKHTKLKKTVAKKGRSAGKTVRKTRAKRKASPRTRSEAKPSLKKAATKTRTPGRRRIAGAKSARLLKKRAPGKRQSLDRTETFAPQGLRTRSAGQSGDLQGLSDVEAADSESVDVL